MVYKRLEFWGKYAQSFKGYANVSRFVVSCSVLTLQDFTHIIYDNFIGDVAIIAALKITKNKWN